MVLEVSTDDKLQLGGFLHLCSQCGSLHTRTQHDNPQHSLLPSSPVAISNSLPRHTIMAAAMMPRFTCYRIQNTESILWFLFNPLSLNQKPQISVHAPSFPSTWCLRSMLMCVLTVWYAAVSKWYLAILLLIQV